MALRSPADNETSVRMRSSPVAMQMRRGLKHFGRRKLTCVFGAKSGHRTAPPFGLPPLLLPLLSPLS